MRESRRIAALFLLLATVRAGAAVSAERVTALELTRTVGSALAGTAQAAADPKGGLDRTKPGFAPFWTALASMRLRVSQIESALERRDGEFFLLVDQGSADLGALRVAWARAGVRNDAIAEGMRIASASYRMLRANYGREGVRHRQGGGLSDAERRQFQRVQRAERRFAESLQPLRNSSQRRGDGTTVAELDRFRSEAERIEWAPLDLEAYLNALIAGGEMRGEWEANAPYIQKNAPEKLAAADAAVEDLYVESDIGQVFAVDLGPAGWSSMEQETEIPAEQKPAAGAVQIYQLAAGETAPPAIEEVATPVSVAEEESEPAAESETESVADPEGLEQTSTEVAEDDFVEEEDLPAAETAAEDVKAEPSPPQAAAQDPKDAKDSKDGKDLKSSKGPKKAAKPAKPKPASPPA
jgi:hypothetical protein